MRISTRKKVSISVLLTFLVLCCGLFALNGAGIASAHGSTGTNASKNASTTSIPKFPSTSTSANFAHHSSECSSSAHFFAAPCKATETTLGNVSFALIGQRLIPLMFYIITSPTLNTACGATDLSKVERTDLDGRFNTTLFALSCVRGTYEIELQEADTPFTVYSTHITIKAP